MATYSRQLWGSHNTANSTARRPQPSSTVSHCIIPRPPASAADQGGEVAFRVAAVLPLLVEHHQQALLERELLELRPPGSRLRHLRVELLLRERLDHASHHRLPIATNGKHLVERRP